MHIRLHPAHPPPTVKDKGGLGLCLFVPLLLACLRPPPPTFPEHASLHQKADYAKGGGALPYVGRLTTNEGRVAFFEELDGYLRLLRQLMEAHERLSTYPLAKDAPEGHKMALVAERDRLLGEAEDLARVVREFLDLAAGGRIMEVAPELEAALRLAKGKTPIPGLDPTTLRERQRLLGLGPAACGAETADPIASGKAPPAFWVMARDNVDADGHEVGEDPVFRARAAKILSASKAQRQAMGQYGVFRRIAGKRGGETWYFQVGNRDRRAVDFRPRVLAIDCDFDDKGRLVGSKEEVLSEDGTKIVL